MTATSVRVSAAPTGWFRRRAAAHPIGTFVGLTYGISWSLWVVAYLLGGESALAQVVFLAGGFGPAVAAAVILSVTGGSVRAWLFGLRRWRVPVRYWAYALGLPAAMYAKMNLVLAATGHPVDMGLLAARLPAYAATFAFVAVLGGGLEEPGWRGFALPKLQERFSPARATLLLGLAWGVWHVPIYGPLGFAVPLLLAPLYTFLFNRTGSVLLAVLLHASFTPAQDHLILLADVSPVSVDAVIGLTYLAAAILMAVGTRGRLGLRAPRSSA